jgi:hypothetical protein
MAYEYRAIAADRPPHPDQLGRYGAEGWALVAMVPHGPGHLLYLMREARPAEAVPLSPWPEREARLAEVRAILRSIQEGFR